MNRDRMRMKNTGLSKAKAAPQPNQQEPRVVLNDYTLIRRFGRIEQLDCGCYRRRPCPSLDDYERRMR